MSYRRALAIALGYALLLFALFWPIWFRGQMSAWDCVLEYWPDLVFQSRAVRHGHWPGWNPFAMGGYPYWADPQTGLYHPTSWLCWIAAALGGDGPWLMQLKVLLSLLAGLCGMHAWTWARTGSHAAAVVAALTFIVGSPLLVHKNGAILWPVLYWPWALWALDRFVAHPTARRGAAVGGAVWLVGAAGHPQSFFYGLLVLAAYWLYLTIAPAPRQTPRALARQAVGGAVAIAIAALLLAATWVPAWNAASDSARVHHDLGYVLQGPLEARALRELVAPNLDTNWMLDVYVGPLAVLGALWLVVAVGAARRWSAAWLAIAIAGVLLAMGEAGHLLPFLARHVPGFDLFRIAYRWKLILGVAAAALAGEAFARLAQADLPVRARQIWAAGAALWLILALALGAHAIDLALAMAVIAGAGAIAWLRGPARRVAIALVPALVLADLWHAGASKLAILQRRPDVAHDVALAAPMVGTDGAWRYHVRDHDYHLPEGGVVPYWVAFLAERREETGYANPIEAARHIDLEARVKTTPTLLAQLGVKYYAGHGALPGAHPVGPGIVALDDVAPLARWYARAEVVAPAQVLDRLAAAPPSQTTAAYVEADDVRDLALPTGDAAPVAGRLIDFSTDEVTVEIDAPAAGVLVLAEAFAPGWTATVGDADARVFRADYHLRAVLVPAGTSRVVFRYQPAGRLALPLLFLLGLLACGLAMLGRWPWLDREAA